MKSALRGGARVLVLATLALAAVAAFAPGRFELALRIYALVVAGTVVCLVLVALGSAIPRETRLDLAPTRPRRPERPPSLARVENEVVLSISSSVDLHYRLVPRLRRVAVGLLASRRGVSLDARPERARELLRAETWELVRPDRLAPQDRLATGIAARDLERVIDALERV